MSSFSKQVLKDSTKDTIVLFHGFLDGGAPSTDQLNTTIFVSQLKGALDANGNPRGLSNGAVVNTANAYYETKVKRVTWSLSASQANGVLQLNWRGSNSNGIIANMASGGDGSLDLEDMLIPYSGVGYANANTGEVFLSANGLTNGSYTVLVHLTKTGPQYDYGRAADPDAFRV